MLFLCYNLNGDNMKITMLGTAALGYPLAFCNCDCCVKAREVKGKSIRKMASVLINDDLIIDLGPDTQTAMTMYDKDMGNIKYLLQTHIHLDHYFEQHLITRIPYMKMKNQHLLNIYAHPSCLQIMSDRISRYEDADLISEKGQKTLLVKSNIINAGEVKQADKYLIKAIETTHDTKHGSLLYLVEYEGKRVLYATDTPPLTDEALEQLKDTFVDCVLLDHTFGDIEYYFSHLNEKLFLEQIGKLRSINCIKDSTLIYATHISHDGNGTHDECEEIALKNGYLVAYDGMEINL